MSAKPPVYSVSEGAAACWSLDHLFLDQDGVPTLAEVKSASDTRLRREVVGQMFGRAGLLYRSEQKGTPSGNNSDRAAG